MNLDFDFEEMVELFQFDDLDKEDYSLNYRQMIEKDNCSIGSTKNPHYYNPDYNTEERTYREYLEEVSNPKTVLSK